MLRGPTWKDAPAWAKFVAMDEGDEWYWYEHQPRWNVRDQAWRAINCRSMHAGFASVPNLTAALSLRGRPKREA